MGVKAAQERSNLAINMQGGYWEETIVNSVD